jgi:hypothetical protein
VVKENVIAANEMSFQMAITGLFIMFSWAILYILFQIRDAVEGRDMLRTTFPYTPPYVSKSALF